MSDLAIYDGGDDQVRAVRLWLGISPELLESLVNALGPPDANMLMPQAAVEMGIEAARASILDVEVNP